MKTKKFCKNCFRHMHIRKRIPSGLLLTFILFLIPAFFMQSLSAVELRPLGPSMREPGARLKAESSKQISKEAKQLLNTRGVFRVEFDNPRYVPLERGKRQHELPKTRKLDIEDRVRPAFSIRVNRRSETVIIYGGEYLRSEGEFSIRLSLRNDNGEWRLTEARIEDGGWEYVANEGKLEIRRIDLIREQVDFSFSFTAVLRTGPRELRGKQIEFRNGYVNNRPR